MVLTSDSRYVVDGIKKGWARSWKRNGWRKADKKPALNADLWDRLLTLLEIHQVKFVWVHGHQGHPGNERCDQQLWRPMRQYKKVDPDKRRKTYEENRMESLPVTPSVGESGVVLYRTGLRYDGTPGKESPSGLFRHVPAGLCRLLPNGGAGLVARGPDR